MPDISGSRSLLTAELGPKRLASQFIPEVWSGRVAMELPLTTLETMLKCIRPDNFSDTAKGVMDYFFPNFLRLDQFHGSSGEIQGIMSDKTFELTGRARERRYAGDRTLDRGRYYALQNPKRVPGRFNPLIGELFAYADASTEVLPIVLDSTIAEDRQNLNQHGITAPGAYLAFVVRENDVAKIPPSLGLPAARTVILFAIEVVEAKIERVIDLRLPATQEWFFHTFYQLELAHRSMEGQFLTIGSDTHKVCMVPDDRKLVSFFDLLPTLVAGNLGGGLHFLQGIGAWLRSHGIFGLVFPSARTDFGVDILDGKLVESWGWNFVLYHGSEPTPWEQYFGKCIRWLDWEKPVRLQIETDTPERAGTWGVRDLRTLQEFKFQHAMKIAQLAKQQRAEQGTPVSP